MKIHDVAQGSGDWLKLRLGIPTASQFHRIVTPTGQFSKQSRAYAHYLLAEQLLNYSLESLQNLEWIARGKDIEPQAVRMYEFEQDAETAPVGFITTDDLRLGATPDRLIVGSAGALEVKCPAPQTHVGYMIEGFGADYVPQVQGQMLVGEFDFVDRYSHHPELPPVLLRTHRDEPYIAKLRAALAEFCDHKDEALEAIRAKGYFAEKRRLLTAADDQARSLGRDLADYLGA